MIAGFSEVQARDRFSGLSAGKQQRTYPSSGSGDALNLWTAPWTAGDRPCTGR
jgi:hypothetical protein